MMTTWLRAIFTSKAAVLLAFFSLSGATLAQQASFSLLQPVPIQPNPIIKSAEPFKISEVHNHRFWDRENSVLFVTSTALTTADFVVTRNNLRNGGQELNPVTRMFAGSTAGLAVNFAGEAVGVVGVSYLCHKTGHHKLERAVSLLNIGSSASAVTFDLIRR